MGKGINLTGQKFNRLTVLQREPRLSPKQGIRWKCICDCGNFIIVRSDNLIQNRIKSCGCYGKEINSLESIKSIASRLPSNSRLTPLYRINETLPNKHKDYAKIYCKCQCGKYTTVAARALVSGTTLSCGCYAREVTIRNSTKYTNNNLIIYSLYRSMIARCYTKTKCGYKNYYLKGVKVCDEWKNDYQKFLDWALANGWKPGLQLDKDIKGNGMLYSPDSCMFVTARDNGFAREGTNKILFNGVEMTIQEVSNQTGVPKTTIIRRHKSGWDLYDAATVPVIRGRKGFVQNEEKYNKK